MKVADLSDAQLLESLKSLCGQGRAVLARLLAHLVEVEKTSRPRPSREPRDTASLLYAEQTFGKEHVERKIRERRDPRQRGSASESCDLAASGLVNLGFRRAEVQRARDTVSAQHRAVDLTTIPSRRSSARRSRS